MKKHKFLLLIFCVMISAEMLVAGEQASPGNMILASYANMQYSRARQLIRKYPTLPEAQFVKAMCAVYDRRKQDLEYGLPALHKIYKDKSFPLEMRVEAGLSYARAAQTLCLRKGIYPIAENIDYQKIYDEILLTYPNTSTSVFALIYKTQDYFYSKDEKLVQEGFVLVKNFLKNYHGSGEYLGPIHDMLAKQYILNYKDYKRSVKQCEIALKYGLPSPKSTEYAIYRLARIYDSHLHDKMNALKWYDIYIQKYPNSSLAPLAKRYIGELEGNGGKNNGRS